MKDEVGPGSRRSSFILHPSSFGRWVGLEALQARSRGLGAVLPIFLLSRLAFYLVALFASDHSAEANQALGFAKQWRWDAINYYSIAVGGYEPDRLPAFFPLLPLLIRAAATLLGGLRAPAPLPIETAARSTLWAGVLVVHGLTLLAFWLLFQLAREETGDEATAQRTVLYTAIFPLAFFYAVPYTEILFLATSVGAFLAARRGLWIRAGLWAAAASATRLAGILLLPVLLLEIVLAWRRGEFPVAVWRGAVLGLLLAPCGLLLFMFHLWQRAGDPLAFLHAQSDFNRTYVFPVTLLGRGLGATYESILGGPSSPHLNHLIALNTFVVLGFLAVLVVSLREWRATYSLYGLLIFALILTSVPDGDILRSTSRYIMVFFPVYLTLARWGARPAVHQAIILLWLPLFGLFTAFYLRGYFVA